MVNELKTLVVVEGARLEPRFFEQLKKVFGLNLDIHCLKYNIYLLYKKMKDMGFNANLKDILLEVNDTEETRALLKENFAFTYLIFDFDPHHTEEYEKDLPIETVVANNIAKVKEMAEYFVDETDPTIGRLYINYPMMEAFKDCDSFCDKNYLTRTVTLNQIKCYKAIVGGRKMGSKRLDGYSREDFTQLICQNVRKLGVISGFSSSAMRYADYIESSKQCNVLNCEVGFIKSLKQIAVLNTSVFFALDYYGNKEGFFDATMENKTT